MLYKQYLFGGIFMEFMKKFKPEQNLIKEFKYWVVLIREKQVTLGSSIIILKREVDSIANVTSEEFAEFPNVVAWFEHVTKNLFGAQKFNYVVAMMKDNFVHYHAFPRYGETFNKYGVEWKDDAWPKVIEFKDIKCEREVIENIKKEMRSL